MKFEFSKRKNDQLFRERGVTFYNVIDAIKEKGILLNIDHPNQDKYPGQKILIVELDHYAYAVPYEIKEDIYFLKTVFPSRKFKHLIEE